MCEWRSVVSVGEIKCPVEEDGEHTVCSTGGAIRLCSNITQHLARVLTHCRLERPQVQKTD